MRAAIVRIAHTSALHNVVSVDSGVHGVPSACLSCFTGRVYGASTLFTRARASITTQASFSSFLLLLFQFSNLYFHFLISKRNRQRRKQIRSQYHHYKRMPKETAICNLQPNLSYSWMLDLHQHLRIVEHLRHLVNWAVPLILMTHADNTKNRVRQQP